ncbi:MAG: SDR family oxidoreductase [Gaiellaceae bacterium]
MERLDGKVAVVTGGSRGIGQATARRLAADGSAVVVSYTSREAGAQETVASIIEGGGRAVAVRADMADPDALDGLFAAVTDEFGGFDILVNNAGTLTISPLAETSDGELDRVFTVNTFGTFRALRHAARSIRDGGRIVNVSTAVTAHPAGGLSVYSGSKAAVEEFTKSLAHELAPQLVTVNTVCPGPTDTDMLDAEFREAAASWSVFNRLAAAEDIADVISLVASDRARWLTGQTIHASGGHVM